MGHHSVVSGYPKSIRTSQVEGLSTGPPGFEASQYHHGELQCSLLRRKMVHFGCVLIIGN